MWALDKIQSTTDPITLDSRIAVLNDLATDTTLELPDGLPYATWAEIGALLVRVEKAIQWWLGDWWRYGEHRYGESASQAAPTGYALQTVQNAAWVADRIDPSRRREDLSWSHHEAVAGLEPPDQDRLLHRAVHEGMNVHHLRAAARKARNGHEPEQPEDVHVHRCSCGVEWDSRP